MNVISEATRMSAELRQNQRITSNYLLPEGLLGGEEGIRTLKTFEDPSGQIPCGSGSLFVSPVPATDAACGVRADLFKGSLRLSP